MATRAPEIAASPREDDEPPRRAHRYLRPPEPIHFPASEEVPETNLHLELRTALYLILKLELADKATIGSDQFVYWSPLSARKKLAPDVFVRRGRPHRPFRVWKTWERGAPDMAVEIVSDADEAEPDWDEKLVRYRASGIRELVRFDPADSETPIRVWDLVDSDLVERAHDDADLRHCEALDLWWVIVEDADLGPMLRIARDREGERLLPKPDERAKAEAAKARAEARRARAEAASKDAEAQRTRAENERLQAEMAALRAQLAGKPKPKKPRG